MFLEHLDFPRAGFLRRLLFLRSVTQNRWRGFLLTARGRAPSSSFTIPLSPWPSFWLPLGLPDNSSKKHARDIQIHSAASMGHCASTRGRRPEVEHSTFICEDCLVDQKNGNLHKFECAPRLLFGYANIFCIVTV